MKIDAHQHFWRYNQTDYVWMSDEDGPLKHDFLPADLTPLLDQIGFDGTIAVQARQMVEETEWLLGLADNHKIIKGVVGWLDLQADTIGANLGKFASHPKLVGVRHLVHDEPDDRFMKRDGFLRGISLLAEHNLTYDLLLFPEHLSISTEIVDSFPNQLFVIDHIAKPAIQDGAMSPWREDRREIGKRENVYCKVSGMVTKTSRHHWNNEDFIPYLDVVFKAFGPERIMIGSDWPVCTLSGAYADVMNVVFRYLGTFDAAARHMVLGGTCAKFYGVS